MGNHIHELVRGVLRGFLAIAVLGIGVMMSAEAVALTINVVGSDGSAVSEYRWLIEEDATYHVVPGMSDPESLASNFHASYMPALAAGDETMPLPDLDPGGYYFISVLPKSGYSIGGAALEPGQGSVTVSVVKHPIPTAQISILVFEDNQPIDGVPEVPQESGLEGFDVVLEEAGGRYGISGGQVMLDAFGNPLGTSYMPDGSVDMMGNSAIKTDSNGEALIKNLSPGKYGIKVVPPSGEGWVQTSTIEGSPIIDAWVKPNEPPFFQEFGPPGPHVFVGFVQPFADASVLNGSSTITGRVTNLHLSRPPDSQFYGGEPVGHTTPWIGLNEMVGGAPGRGIFAGPAGSDATFAIQNVPPGDYQLKVWDSSLVFVIATFGVNVPAGGGAVALGDMPVFQWFARLENHVFNDENENGFRDEGEAPIPEQAVNLRWRDGTIYQSFPTDGEGFVPFDEVFPFFNWLVAEVDFARFKATGATIVVDAGGPVNPADPWSFEGVLTPQLQPDNGNLPYRVETGPVLTQGFQAFLGQTNVIMWGKKAYGPGENGGISGIVYYAITRAENDPAYAAAEPWEPGIARVVVNLYEDADEDGIIDDLNGDGNPTPADVDNHPFDNFPGLEDVDHDDDGVFDAGDAIQIAATDSWDDSVPTECPGDPLDEFYFGGKCYDGLRNWNQVRPGVFDGGYAFSSYHPGGIASGSEEVDGLPSGIYIVESVPPRSAYGQAYEIMKEEDKNVDFGDEYVVSPLLLPPPCVGDEHVVPAELDLFPGIEAPYAGDSRPLCDRKQVYLTEGKNAAADFFMFTEVPIAAHAVGMVLNDLANEFDPNSPQFGEKYAPPWIPISIRDWTGTEIVRTHTDEYGRYNILIPSTFTADRPMPSGMAPHMLTIAINDPGPIQDPVNPGLSVIDPFFNRQYSQFSYTFQFMPGATTYLDTPVLPVAAFAGPGQFPLDCELPDRTPRIYTVSGPDGGPYAAAEGDLITITAIGSVEVPNPQYDGPGGANAATIVRDYGFGAAKGTVTIGGVPLDDILWSTNVIKGRIAAGTATGQLVVKRNDSNRESVTGVTFTVGGPAPIFVQQGGSVQAAIDAAQVGDLIIIPPGQYDELVVMWKPVKLQGWGEASTTINAVKIPSEKLALWANKVDGLIASSAIDLLPAQIAAGNTAAAALFNEQGPGIIVLSKNAIPADGGFGLDLDGKPNARIDGLTVTGADLAGGIVVNGYAHHLIIGNNQIVGNNGIYGGGIRIGHADLETDDNGEPIYQSGFNDNIVIRHNRITRNATQFGAGGGLSIYTGTDAYQVHHNFICGNFAQTDGAGIGHLGLSDGGLIEKNAVVFNQSFDQGVAAAGGGVLIAGAAPMGDLSEGAGSVKVVSNLIQGNNAGAGDGGGIRTSMVNGQDVETSPLDPSGWYEIQLLNNTIINNVAGLAGGGISMQDTARVAILHNTIAHNDSTATTAEAFTPGIPNQSNPQPAGVVARKHSAALTAAFGVDPAVDPFSVFSNPVLANNIIWQNRSFYFLVDAGQDPTAYILKPDISGGEDPVYADLAVLGTGGMLTPMNCVLTETTGYDASNADGDPLFVSSYVNGPRSSVLLPEPAGGIPVMPAFDEGGNFIDVQYGPLTIMGDHHIQDGSAALDTADTAFASMPGLDVDFEGDPRPTGAESDIGADEIYVVPNVDPIAMRDRVSTRRNMSVVIKVLANDYDPDGNIDPASVSIIMPPLFGGFVTTNGNGTITYAPRNRFVGNDFFTYTVADDRGGVSNVALVWVRVLRSR